MRRWHALVLASLLVGSITSTQAGPRVYSDPSVPSREALEKLRLVKAWFTVVPVEGRRDGIRSIQLAGTDLLVQTRSGLVVRLDAENGRTYWRSLFGTPYLGNQPLAFNSSSVFAINGAQLFSLDRLTGDKQWSYRLPGGVSAPPVADEQQIYLGMATSEIIAYGLPVAALEQFGSGSSPALTPSQRDYANDGDTNRSAYSGLGLYRTTRPKVGPRPTVRWSTRANVRMAFAPVTTKVSYLVASPEGDVRSYAKYAAGRTLNTNEARLKVDGIVTTAPGHFDEMAYVGSHDSNVYAMNMDSGKLVWRYTAGRPIVQMPVAFEKEVFVVSKDHGMACVDRETGEPKWKIPSGRRVLEANPEAVQFIAANPKFVYALGRLGRLVILDRKRGTTVSSLDISGFNIVVNNEYTDRLYLAANNGLIVCLHDQAYTKPIAHRKLQTPKQALEAKLDSLVTVRVGQTAPFRNLMAQFGQRYGLKITISEQAFKRFDREAVLAKEFTIPEVNQTSVRDLLKKILDAADAISIVIDDSILIAPRGRNPAPNP